MLSMTAVRATVAETWSWWADASGTSRLSSRPLTMVSMSQAAAGRSGWDDEDRRPDVNPVEQPFGLGDEHPDAAV